LWYERHEYRRIVDSAAQVSTGHLVLVLLAGDAGLRRGEIRAMKWSDLDLPRRMIRVQRGFWRRHEDTTKGGRGRDVPMTDELAKVLQAHRHLRGERVLYSERGEEISNRVVRNWLGTVLRHAGLEVTQTTEGKNKRDVGAIHRLRHTFCSHLAAAGVPAKAIQELAGHRDLKTTQRYMT
jgi:integrase